MAEEAKKYPEHEKLHAVRSESQAIGAFVEWLGENGYYICQERRPDAVPASGTVDVPVSGSRRRQSMGELFCEVLERAADAACLYWPTSERLPEALLAKYFEIDPNKLEDEKLAMLEVVRSHHESKQETKNEAT